MTPLVVLPGIKLEPAGLQTLPTAFSGKPAPNPQSLPAKNACGMGTTRDLSETVLPHVVLNERQPDSRRCSMPGDAERGKDGKAASQESVTGSGALVHLRSQPGTELAPLTPPATTALAPLVERPLTPELVFREYAPRIYALARRMLGNDADAEDVTQDVLLQVVRKLNTFRGESQLGTWLHRVTVNAALAHRAKRASRQKHETTEVEDATFDTAVLTSPVKRWYSSPEEPILTAEQAEIIEKAIRQLPEPYRDIYVLADVEHLSNAEIAERLGLSVAAVKSRLHRARLRMRAALARYFEQDSGTDSHLPLPEDSPDGGSIS